MLGSVIFRGPGLLPRARESASFLTPHRSRGQPPCWSVSLEVVRWKSPLWSRWAWLLNARHVKNVPGRPKTDKLDAVCLAKVVEAGMCRPSRACQMVCVRRSS